ncbi:histidine phosphatase family protein [Nonomuraea longicatena]|uniref:Histidine phosphatase family protein n=1 Tax=Nonomuraea longicatena TaxID=83682 RepID=A0ABN1P8Y0_9ACTN
MATRNLYLVRHGAADVFGELTEHGRRQASLLGERLARVPVDTVWHSPLPRALASAHELARHLPGVPVAEAAELIDHIPETPPSRTTPCGGHTDTGADRTPSDALVARFARSPGTGHDRHDVLVTHAHQIAWLVRHALDAPPSRWRGLNSANAALTLIEYRSDAPPALVMFNDLSHLPPELRWTGLPEGTRP